jgi:hypothetical protein
VAEGVRIVFIPGCHNRPCPRDSEQQLACASGPCRLERRWAPRRGRDRAARRRLEALVGRLSGEPCSLSGA